MKMKKCFPLPAAAAATTVLLNLVNYLKLMFREAFTHLCLLNPKPEVAEEEEEEGFHNPDGYVLLMDSESPSLIPVPLQVVTTMIKKKLAVVEYGDFMQRSSGVDDEQVVAMTSTVCRVCLESMEMSDEMRELCNCRHVFHKRCLDTWVNQGRLTCPLCRSTLYPHRINCSGRPGSWIMSCS